MTEEEQGEWQEFRLWLEDKAVVYWIDPSLPSKQIVLKLMDEEARHAEYFAVEKYKEQHHVET